MTWSASQQEVRALGLACNEALDLLGLAWLVCEVTGHPVACGQSAEKILKADDGLRLNSNGVLCATLCGEDKPTEILDRAIETSTARHFKIISAIFTARRTRGKRAFTLLVRSIGTTAKDKQISRGKVLVLILDTALYLPTERDIRQLSGLITRESCQAPLLMDGCTREGSSDVLRISRSTGSAHLKCLIRKTQSQQRSEPVSVLMKAVGMIRLRQTRPGRNPALASARTTRH